MQIVINIDDKIYEGLKRKDKFNDIFLNYYEKLITNGVVLPQGHGDLKDINNLKHAFIMWSTVVQGNFSNADIASIIHNSPTIIEADKKK